MKKILITGGGGFIGYHLAKKLSRNNFVYLLDNFQRGKKDKDLVQLLKKKNVKLFRKDLLSKFKLNLKKIDVVYHLAAILGVKNVTNFPETTFKTNFISMINLLDELKRIKFKGKFIFFSTSEVYSPLIFNKKAKQPISDQENILLGNKTSKRDSYYLSKITCEKYLELTKLNFKIVRPHNIYGPRMGMSHVIPELIKKFMFNRKKILVYSPNHKRAFCFIDDAIEQIIRITNSPNKNRVYNVGNPKLEISMYRLASLIKKILKSNAKIEKGENTIGSPPRRVPNIKSFLQINKNIKFTDLTIGIKKTLSWYKINY